MKTNYVLIDFENVQPKNMSLLKDGPFQIKVFLGSNQSKIPLEMARALQAFGPNAEYIQIEGNGNNALDFHIAFYIGELSNADSNCFFHIISKDSGFDPLIKHLKIKKILCQRSTSISDIPLIKISNSTSTPEKVAAIIDNLIKRGTSRPRSINTLKSSIKSLFINKIDDQEVEELFDLLVKNETIQFTKEKINYNFHY